MKVAVVGASGIVGRAVLEHLMHQGIDVVGLARRKPVDLPGAPFIAMDLQVRSQCEEVIQTALGDVTHVVYAALFELPGLIAGWQAKEQMQTNLQMLQNLLEPLQQHGRLRHVTLLQGTKAYGAHVAPMKIPGVESDPRHPHNNFYWLQEDYLKSLSDSGKFEYTIWRPQIIFGHALHAPMNMLAALSAYAAIQKDKNEPFYFPGGPSGVTEAIDADLLARAICFAFDNPACANQTFNITNGDVFRWQDIWPVLASIFGLKIAEPQSLSLAATLYDESDRWQQIVQKHGLQENSLQDLVGDSFYYADALLNYSGTQAPPPTLLSTIRLRETGFAECLSTPAMFERWVAKLRHLKVIPA